MIFLKKYIFIISIAFGTIFQSCEELPCENKNGVQLNAGFYSYNGVAISDTSFYNLTLILGNDDATYYIDSYQKETQAISFPLSMISDSSRVILVYNTQSADTIIFYYTKSLHLESHACGFDEFFEITEIKTTTHQLDSIWIRNDQVDYGKGEHIKIYY